MGTEHKFEVAIKWSCFPLDRADFQGRAPGVLKMLADGVDEDFMDETGDSVEIAFRSTKEVRYGKVTIRPTREGLRAAGMVREEWDDLSGIAETLGLYGDDDGGDDDVLDSLREVVPFCDGEPGVGVEFDFEVTSVDQLLERLRQEEDKCIWQSGDAWKELEGLFKKPETEC